MNWVERTGTGTTGLPNTPARSLVVNPATPAWIYVGTDIGVFASEDAGLTWRVPADGPANVAVDDIFMMGGHLVAATYGRGMFRANLAITTAFPGTPTGVTAVAGNGQAAVSWTAPAWSGLSAITGYVVTPYVGGVAGTPVFPGNVTSTIVNGLDNGTTYTFTVAATNTQGTGGPSTHSNAVTPLVFANPSSFVVVSGTLSSGNAASLASDDNAYLNVASSGSRTRVASWYGVVTGVPNALATLKVTYKGKISRSCPQALAIHNHTTSQWRTLDTRSVGPAEVEITDLAVPAPLAEYVSGGAGNGEVWVRVRCSLRVSRTGFTTNADLLKIVYG